MNILPAETRIGHVHLRVSNLERSLGFYRDLLGFELMQRYGPGAAFVSAGGYHHHIGLNTWDSLGATPPPPGHTGLYHVAILLPTRRDLAVLVKRLMDTNYPIDGASDHGVSEALYLRDPDDNGVELYVDRQKPQWPKAANGELSMTIAPLDFPSLMKELEQ